MASLGLLNILIFSKRSTMCASLDGSDEVVTKNLEQHVRDGIQAINERNFNIAEYPWTGAASDFHTINPTGCRPPADNKVDAIRIMKYICTHCPNHQMRIHSLFTQIYVKEGGGKFADVFMNGDVSGAPGLKRGVWRPMVTVWSYRLTKGEWFCISEESIDGVQDDAIVIHATSLYERTVSNEVLLKMPKTPQAGLLTVDANYHSYSIEFSSMQDFAGNHSHPNKFSHQLLQNLKDKSGALPIIRAGGTTANRAIYHDNQTAGIINYYSGDRTWLDQPTNVSIEPRFFESFQQFPASTQYIFTLNFNVGEAGFNQTLLEAFAAWNALGESIYAFEIGNEVDGWGKISRRPKNWNQHDYVREWQALAEAISKNCSIPLPRFQGCAYTAPRNITIGDNSWNVANTIRAGLDVNGHLKSVSDHDYMGADCDGKPRPTIAGNLLNHHHMTSLMYWHEALGNDTQKFGIPYVIGETNSITCQGTPNVSDVFASVLWSIDYTLYGAGINVSRMYFHMGRAYRYSPWQPVTINNTAPYVKPLYYGNLFTFAALSGGNKQVVNLLNTTSLTAYALYEDSALQSIAIVNRHEFNATSMPAVGSERGCISFQLDVEKAMGFSHAQVRRLSAPGTDSKVNITFAGQTVDNETGKIFGELNIEAVEGGRVLMGSGEAVLITLQL
ncbi:Beta-glucuronidase [Pseudocercospora fuligena]|uniref:Beta-glucuronidase n=1 Tax=Pseudocercospora fuligena TaxID=685502 RepID=A0A8H6R5Y0_9PEZI|nr:Beta-glucuronidase [Pseudocercospora fuligena]